MAVKEDPVSKHWLIHSTTRGGHRRAGMRFVREPVAIDAASISESVLQQLQADPRLVVQEGDGPFEGDPDGSGLSHLTVRELRERAAADGIELGDARRKDEIIAVIEQAGA